MVTPCVCLCCQISVTGVMLMHSRLQMCLQTAPYRLHCRGTQRCWKIRVFLPEINGTHHCDDTQPEVVSDGVMLPRDWFSQNWFHKAKSPRCWSISLCYSYDVTEIALRSYLSEEVWDFVRVILSMFVFLADSQRSDLTQAVTHK